MRTSLNFDNQIHIHLVHSCAGRKPSRMKVRQDPPAPPGYNGKQGGERFRTILKYLLATDKAMKRHRDNDTSVIRGRAIMKARG